MQNAIAGWTKLYRPENLIYLVVYVVYAVLRVLNFRQLEPPRFTPDSSDYIHLASFSLFDLEFWTGNRPPLYPFFIKVFGQDLNALAIFQLCLSILAWGVLAYAVSKQMKDYRFGRLVFTLILLFSATILMVPWDAAVMTEALNFSLFALILGLWFLQTRNKSWILLTVLTLLTFLWTFLRETNAWLILIIGAGIFVLGVWQRTKRNVTIGIILCLAFLINYFSAGFSNSMEQRWVFPFLNVIGKKILRNEERVKWFEQYGMPVSQDLMEMEGEYAHGKDRRFYTSPELTAFREWVIQDGRRTYVRFLLRDNHYLFVRPFMDLGYLAVAENTDSYQPDTFQLLLPPEIQKIILLDINPKILVWIGVTISILSILILCLKKNESWLLVSIILLMFFPHIILVWHGDTMSLSRHTLLSNIQLRLAIWFFIFFLMNEYLSNQQQTMS